MNEIQIKQRITSKVFPFGDSSLSLKSQRVESFPTGESIDLKTARGTKSVEIVVAVKGRYIHKGLKDDALRVFEWRPSVADAQAISHVYREYSNFTNARAGLLRGTDFEIQLSADVSVLFHSEGMGTNGAYEEFKFRTDYGIAVLKSTELPALDEFFEALGATPIG